MKKILIVFALIAGLLVPASANAAETKFEGGPLNNLDSQGAIINISLSGVPAKAGLYIQECVQTADGSRPTVCNKAAELWISTAPGALFLPTDTIKFKPTGSFVVGTTTVDCTVAKCGIFMRFDHNASTDLSEDQFFPLTFKTAAAGTVTLPADEITATINGIAVSTKAPITLSYRQLSLLKATSKAGATLSFATLAPLCALKGLEITPLRGAGECAIAVTSAGNSTASGVTAILPIILTPGVQTAGDFAPAPLAKAGQVIELPKSTNFGEKIIYRAYGACSISGTTATIKKELCRITAKAAARKDVYLAFKASYTIKGK